MKSTITILMLALAMHASAQLRKLFERETMYQHFSGVALVMRGDSTLLEYKAGKADENRAIDLQSSFDVGSITKQFTAAGILHLVEDEKFDLRDPINELLGNHASDRWNKVTVHQLLTHTSGIPSLYQTEQGLEIFLPEEEPIELSELIARFKDGKLLFSPGEEFGYSNSGYILLAAIIEQVSGMSYEQFMKQLFEKYGLNETSFEPDNHAAKPYYGYRDDLVKKAPVYHSSWLKGAGGAYSTAHDLAKWTAIVQSDAFLTKSLRRTYLKPHTNRGYGYGWVHNEGVISHDGGSAGFTSHLSFDTHSNEKVIILTNRSFEEIKKYGKSAAYVQELVDKCWKNIKGGQIEVLPMIQTQSSPESLRFEKGIVLAAQDSLLTVRSVGTYPSRIIPNTPMLGTNSSEEKMLEIAEFLKKKKYWSLARHCDGEMKFVMFSGLMSVGMRMMKKQTGGADGFIPYFVDDQHGIVRMKGPEGILDLIVYFDEEGKIKGIFEHGFYESDEEVEMLAYPIGNSLYFLDGLPYGEKSATIKVTDEAMTIYQLNRSVVFESQVD